jgi:hypothetical protein
MKIDSDTLIVLSEVYEGVLIKTDGGMFCVYQRDGGIEVTLNGELVYAYSAGAEVMADVMFNKMKKGEYF